MRTDNLNEMIKDYEEMAGPVDIEESKEMELGDGVLTFETPTIKPETQDNRSLQFQSWSMVRAR